MKDGSMGAIGGSESGPDNKISFEQFMETRASQNIFDNDVSFLIANPLIVAGSLV